MKNNTIYGIIGRSYCLEVCLLVFLDREEANKACKNINIILDKINNSYKYKLTNKQIQSEFKKLDKYLVDYYGGCGELNNVKVKELKPAKPFASWNLD